MTGIRARRIMSDTVIYIILIVMSFIWLLPLVWLVGASLHSKGTPAVTFFPTEVSLYYFKELLTNRTTSFNYARWFLNTFIVACGTCAISTMLVLMVSYALSRMRFKMRRPFMNIALLLGLFPSFLSMIIIYFLFKMIGLEDSLFGLILVYSIGAGAGFYITKGFFDTIPMAIDEAARIDGASKNRIFWTMTIPLSKPIIVYTILTSFLGPWCDFMMVRIMINNSENYTVALGLQIMITTQGMSADNFTRFCCGAVVISIPITILFIIMQRYYVEGITGGAAKG